MGDPWALSRFGSGPAPAEGQRDGGGAEAALAGNDAAVGRYSGPGWPQPTTAATTRPMVKLRVTTLEVNFIAA